MVEKLVCVCGGTWLALEHIRFLKFTIVVMHSILGVLYNSKMPDSI